MTSEGDMKPKPDETTGKPPRDVRGRAARIVGAVNAQLDALEESVPLEQVQVVGARLPGVLGLLFKVIDSADPEAAAQRVAEAQARFPDLDKRALAQRLIRDKALRTGAVGASTSVAGAVPGLGTIAATTLGVTADIVATFRLQVELVMELAHLAGREMTRAERRTAILAITGLGAGLDTAVAAVTTRVAARLGEEYAEKAILKALPVLGILASAGTDVLATYVVGKRALAYFGGAELAPYTEDVTGVSEQEARLVARWWAAGRRRAADLAADVGPIAAAAGAWTLERAGDLLPRAGQAARVTVERAGPPARWVGRTAGGLLGGAARAVWGAGRWAARKVRRTE